MANDKDVFMLEVDQSHERLEAWDVPFPANAARLLHLLNQRYREEFDRAERLEDELNDLQRSRLFPIFAALRRWTAWLRRWHRGKTNIPNQIGAVQPYRPADIPCTIKPLTGKISIIIPFRDQWPLLQTCLQSLNGDRYADREVILVDNGSMESETLNGLSRIVDGDTINHVRIDEPFNFARLCNRGAALARGDILLFLNNDVIHLQPDGLERLAACIQEDVVGIAGALLLYPDQTIQHAGLMVDGAGRWHHPHRGQPFPYGVPELLACARWSVPAVTGACLAMRRDRFASLGGFDERWPTDYNDVDLCQRAIQKGWQVILSTSSIWLHFESLSRGYRKEATAWQPR